MLDNDGNAFKQALFTQNTEVLRPEKLARLAPKILDEVVKNGHIPKEVEIEFDVLMPKIK